MERLKGFLKKIAIPVIIILFFVVVVAAVAGFEFIATASLLTQFITIIWVIKEGPEEFIKGSQKLWKDIKAIF